MSITDTRLKLPMGAPLQVEALARESAQAPPRSARRVWVVVPCYNRPGDLRLLMDDLVQLYLGQARATLGVLIVDNASSKPLEDLPFPDGLHVEHLRLESNTGGSGGFNAGLAEALMRPLAGGPAEFIWMVDSDARVEPGALLPLLDALEQDPALAAAGSALVDPATGEVHEIGGRLHRWTGRFEPAAGSLTTTAGEAIIHVDYIAACSALVRREAIERTGLMPDVFLNADDVEWFIRMGRRAGGIAAIPASRAAHPTFDRFQTWARYYIARNGFGPIDAMGLGGTVRLIRALREVGRATLQAMMGRDDLADLHLAGLRDAADGRRVGPAPKGRISFEAFHPHAELGDAIKAAFAGRPLHRTIWHPRLRIPEEAASVVRSQLQSTGVAQNQSTNPTALAVLGRLITGPAADLAIVPARGRPDSWLLGRTMVIVSPEGFVIRRMERSKLIGAALRVVVRGSWVSLRLALGAGRHGAAPLPRAPGRQTCAPIAVPEEPARGGDWVAGLSLSVIVLSYNRWPALDRTLRALQESPIVRRQQARIIVVDNGSSDGTPAHIRECYPEVELIAIEDNRGAGAFNLGAAASSDDLLLILDDDAVPDFDALDGAVELLSRRMDIGGVALHPRHPETRRSEWAFAEELEGPCDGWPVMGCGNLVRREAWNRVGGYEDAFFLYRNDADLAMKLLASGDGVYFDPGWVVWHDSPAAASKSLRWFELAMRNWIWLCRRHGRGISRAWAMATGWAWAHKLAGHRVASHWRTVRGVLRGFMERPPALPGVCERDGKALARLMWLRVGRK